MSDYRPQSATNELQYPGPLARGARDRHGQRAVHRIQEWCSFQGFGTGIDGDFGPATELTLKNFQNARQLPATGTLDKETWDRLIAPLDAVLDANTAVPGESVYGVALRTARRHLGVHPVELGGQNCGPWVRLYMHGQDGKDQLWCAGFSCFVLSQAAAAQGHDGPPIPYRVGVDALVADARDAGRYVAGAPGTRPDVAPGSLFAERSLSNPNDWIHTGIVIALHDSGFETIEGNANHANGTNNGYEVCTKTRAYGRYDFIRLN